MTQEIVNVVAVWSGVIAALGLVVILVAGFRAFPAEETEPTQTQIRVAKFAAAYFGPRGERYDADGVPR